MYCWSCAVTAACTHAGRDASDEASSSAAKRTAQAPSELGQKSSIRTGCASIFDSSTCSTVRSGIFSCACGLRQAFRRALTATFAACSAVTPDSLT